jgi:hypothetical protein
MNPLRDCTSKEKKHTQTSPTYRRWHTCAVRSGSGVCASREPCVKAKGILDRVPSCVNRQFVTSIRGLNRESTQQAKGCITVLGTKTVPWPQRSGLHRGLEAWGIVPDACEAIEPHRLAAAPSQPERLRGKPTRRYGTTTYRSGFPSPCVVMVPVFFIPDSISPMGFVALR